MLQLIKFELIKLVKRKSSIAVVLVGLVVTAFLFALPVFQFRYYTESGPLEGAAGIAAEKADENGTGGLMTGEFVANEVRSYQTLFDNPENVGTDGVEETIVGPAYWNDVAPRERLLQTIAFTYDAPGDYRGLSTLRALDVAECEAFYEARDAKVSAILEAPTRELGSEARAFWESKSRSVGTPFEYGYYRGWDVILTSFELLVFSILAVCIALAPVFSGEYLSGTDSILLSSRYGRTKLATAKVAASLLFGTAAFTLIVAVALAIPLAFFGTDGWNLPVQISNTAIPYNLTFLGAVTLNLGVIYLVLFAMMGLTLFLSSKMKSPYLVLVVLVPVLFLPLFLAPTGTAGLFNQTLFLLPYRATMPELDKFITYQLGPLVVDAFVARAVVYLACCAACLPLAKRAFGHHQISG